MNTPIVTHLPHQLLPHASLLELRRTPAPQPSRRPHARVLCFLSVSLRASRPCFTYVLTRATATDTPEMRQEARRRYGARAVFQDVPVAHTGEQHGCGACLSCVCRCRVLRMSALCVFSPFPVVCVHLCVCVRTRGSGSESRHVSFGFLMACTPLPSDYVAHRQSMRRAVPELKVLWLVP